MVKPRLNIKISILLTIINILSIIKQYYCIGFISVPFKKANKINNSMSQSEIIDALINNTIIVQIGLGTPYQNLSLDISTTIQATYIVSLNSSFDTGAPKDLVEFDYTKSSSFINSGTSFTTYNIIRDSKYIKDNMKIGNLNIKNLSLVLAKSLTKNERTTKHSGVFGLSTNSDFEFGSTYKSNFIKNVKEMNLINSYDFFFEFTKEDEGNLIIGATPNEYDNKKYNNINLTYAKVPGYGQHIGNWGFNIHSATYNGIKINGSSFENAFIKPEYGLISFPIDIKNVIVKNYFKELEEKNICSLNYNGLLQGEMYICNTNKINKKGLGILSFYNGELQKTFEFDLSKYFLDIGDKSYFLCNFNVGRYILLGEIFLKNNLFIFNQDSKLVAFYDELQPQQKAASTKSYLTALIIVTVVSFVLVASLIFALIKIPKKLLQRKRRAVELADNYEYISDNKNNEKV